MGYHEVSIGDGSAWKCTSSERDEWYTKLTCLFPDFGYGGFPGLMPTSLERKHLQDIEKRTFWYAEKTDGTRACLWCTRYKGKNVCTLFDRTMSFSLLVVTSDPSLFHETVLDGELVWDRVRSRHVFLVFDCLMYRGEDYRERRMSDRIERYQKACRFAWICGNFLVEAKPMVKHVRDIPVHGGWDVDGVILVPEEIDLQTTGYKWKTEHTVDFVMHRAHERWMPHVFHSSKHVPVDVTIVWVEPLAFDETDGTVVECRYARDRRAWIPVRVRRDKRTPNSWRVYQSTVHAIEENIEKSELDRGDRRVKT